MPSVPAPAKVLVTGASGYLALHIITSLLDRGYAVRGTVRNEEKGAYLKAMFKNDNLEYIVVPSIEAPGAFDEAVKGVDGVIHAASPVGNFTADTDTFIRMAVEGTTGILKSAKLNEPNIKRIVITSSNVAIDHPVESKRIFTENDWNDRSVETVREKGSASTFIERYTASKTLAERAAWDFIEANKSEIQFDIDTLCPPMIFGPMLHKLETQKDINVSNSFLYQAITANEKDVADSTVQIGNFVDARDIARIHVDLLSIPEASNERYIPAAGQWTYQDVWDALQEEPVIPGAPIGNPGAAKGKVHNLILDSSKLNALLGVPHEETFRPFSQSVRDFAVQVKEKGWF